MRLLAAELGEHGVKVNGVNPDGVVQAPASSRAAGAPTAPRSTAWRRRTSGSSTPSTILKREVLPEHIANAVFVLCGPDMTHTTGLHVPVDAGVAAAFLR